MAKPTRRERVHRLLQQAAETGHYQLGDNAWMDAPEGWVPGWHLAHPAVGGSEGLRRLRELRDDGVDVEMRQREGSDGYEYRLAPHPGRLFA